MELAVPKINRAVCWTAIVEMRRDEKWTDRSEKRIRKKRSNKGINENQFRVTRPSSTNVDEGE